MASEGPSGVRIVSIFVSCGPGDRASPFKCVRRAVDVDSHTGVRRTAVAGVAPSLRKQCGQV